LKTCYRDVAEARLRPDTAVLLNAVESPARLDSALAEVYKVARRY